MGFRELLLVLNSALDNGQNLGHSDINITVTLTSLPEPFTIASYLKGRIVAYTINKQETYLFRT